MRNFLKDMKVCRDRKSVAEFVKEIKVLQSNLEMGLTRDLF